MKKIISLLLCLCLVIGMTPAVWAAEELCYLALGDSITAGTGLKEGESAFPEIIANSNGYTLNNQGANGLTAAGIYAMLSEGTLDETVAQADLITITCGGNDLLDLLYAAVADAYNAVYEPDIAADDVVVIFANSLDPRYLPLMFAALEVMRGSESTGTPPFVERAEFQAEIEAFIGNLNMVTAYIRERNPDANIIIPTQYNPYKDFGDMLEILASTMDTAARKLNSAIVNNAEAGGYLVADVFNAFQNSGETLCNATMFPMELDFHPNAAGHGVMAQVFQSVIDQIAGTKPVVNPFADVKEEDYFFDSVMWAVSREITMGVSDTSFAPEEGCTREQVVTFLWRAAGKPAPTSGVNPFHDVLPEDYCYDAVLWAVEKGITMGAAADSFAPEEVCTRAQVVTFLWRAAGKPAPQSEDNPFTDVGTDEYYYDAVRWAVEQEITLGTGNGKYEPDSTCTRAQIVTFIYRSEHLSN